MAKNLKKGLSAILAALMCAGTMSTAAFAAETLDSGNIWNGDDLTVNVNAGENGYTFISVFRDPADSYEISNHVLNDGNGNAIPQTLMLVDASSDYTWTPSGLYSLGTSNYEALYCCDAVTGYKDGIYYKRLNLEDSDYYTPEAAAHIRAIITNSYPYVSMEQMKADLVEAGVEGAADMTRSDLIAGVQAAVWYYANGSADFDYLRSYNVAATPGYGTVLHDFTAEMSPAIQQLGNKKTLVDSAAGKRVETLADYLKSLDQVYAAKNEIIISDLNVTIPNVAEEGTYNAKVNVQLNNSGSSEQDNIVISIYVDDVTVNTESVVLGKENYTFDIPVAAGQIVKAVVSGTQVLPKGVYFYEPEGRRDVSQSLVGVAMGETNVYAEKEAVPVTTEFELRKVDENGAPLTGAAFTLYRDDKEVGVYEVDNNGALVIDKLVPGEYKLVETKAPDGYELPEEAIEFVISDDGTLTVYPTSYTDIQTCEKTVTNIVTEELPNGTAVPAVTIDLTPGASNKKQVISENVTTEKGDTYSKVSFAVRNVDSSMTEIAITSEVVATDLKAPQSALKFDRNSSADQKIQQKARDLYTDTGHFTDPDSVTVTGAPEGYPYKYIGTGDYSGHYVSHIRVVYDRDENGNAKVDANGNYVIKELQHSNGTPLTIDLEPTLSFDGPYDQTTGTRPLQFLLKDEAGNTFYGYCIDLETGAQTNTWYAIANLEDNEYYASEDAENHVRNIALNGYWGTEEGTGSLASLKEALKVAVADGKIDKEYDINFRNRTANKGQELTEDQYASENYVYTKLYQHVTLTDEVIDGLTEGEALDAMQAAIWSFANGSNHALDGTDRMIVGDMYYASSAMGDSRNGVNDFEGAARTKALYTYLTQLNVNYADTKSTVINDKTFAEDMTLTVGNEISEGIYEAELTFALNAKLSDKDNLSVLLTYVDAYGETQIIKADLTGEDAIKAENGYYTLSGLELREDEAFEFALSIAGEQYLEKGAYIFTSQGGTGASQTMVSMMEGMVSVNVTKSATVTFSVSDFARAEYTYYSQTLVVENTTVPPTVSFNEGDVSNISFMLIDKKTGEIEWLCKKDAEEFDSTTVEIPYEEGKISAVFMKQGDKYGLFWFSEEVDEDIINETIKCVDENNPSYKGYSDVAFGAGDHSYEFKNGKIITYTFSGCAEVELDDDTPAEGPSEDGTTTPETDDNGSEGSGTENPTPETEVVESEHGTHLLGDAEGSLELFNFKFVDEYEAYLPEEGDERYVSIGGGEQTEFWSAFLYTEPSEALKASGKVEGEVTLRDKNGTAHTFYTGAEVNNGRPINGIYLDGEFYSGGTYTDGKFTSVENENITYTDSKLQASYNGLNQGLLVNGNGKKVAVYCADQVTGTDITAKYNIVNLEDAVHYDEDTADKIRAVAVNGYWGGTEEVNQDGTLEKVEAMMKASGKFTQEEIDLLSPGVALAATQFAIWELANEDDNRQIVNVQYIVKNRVAGYNGLPWNTLKNVVPESEVPCVDLIFKLSNYLVNLPGISVEDMTTSNTVLNPENILRDVEIEVLYKAECHENNADDNKDNDAYVTNVIFDMLPVSEKDNLVAKIVDKVTKEVYAKRDFSDLINNRNGTYTFSDVVLVENNVNNYTVVVEGVQYLERNVYLYFAGERGASQTMIGYDEGEFSVDVESTVEKSFNVDEPETPPTVTFENGDASNISFMLIDEEGNVEFLNKIDIENETSFEIPTEEGKISAVFIKQSTSGMFWFAEEVNEETQQTVIECLKANNPSYKGHNAIAFDNGEHELEFKKGKFVTYTFEGFEVVDIGDKKLNAEVSFTTESIVDESIVEEPIVEEPVVDESTVEEPTVPVYGVEGADIAGYAVINDITAIYIEKDGKVPAVIWVSEEVDSETAAEIIDELGADSDITFITGLGDVEIEYQHNKKKTKTVTYTFFEIAE